MIEALFNQPNYLAAKQLLNAATLQQEAIANNLANVETPNYHRIQVNSSFANQLSEALRSQDSRQLQTATPYWEEDPTAVATRLDGNNVILEKEMLYLMQNSVNQAFDTQLITGNLLRLRLAITGHS